MIYEDRWYQTEAIDAPFIWFETHPVGNPLIAMPTGTGKSVVIAKIIQRAVQGWPGTRIIKLTHRKKLIEQNFKKLLEIWPLAPAGIYSAGLGRKECHLPITYAGIDSVSKKAHLFGHIDLVLVDEAHLIAPNEWGRYLAFFTALWEVNPNIRIIGLTATPYRNGMGHLTEGGFFTDVCYDLTSFDKFNRLIDEGFLCPLVPRRSKKEIDLGAVRTSGGDYNLGDLQAAMDRDEITSRAIDEMIVQGSDRNHWLVFTTGIEHAKHVTEELVARGITAVAIHSKMSDEEADEAFAGWVSGKYQAAVNNDILTTGVDFPAIDLIAVLRPSKSAALWVQMLGRGTRPCEGKSDCLVLDFAGNTRRLGPINDPVLPQRRGARKGKGDAPVKCCEACSTWNHASVRVCVSCGEEFKAAVRFEGEASELELIAKGKDPVVEVFEVDNVTYAVHHPRDGRPASLRVTYFSGLRSFSEHWCFNHGGGTHYNAMNTWRDHSTSELDAPETTEDAFARRDELRPPRTIRVWVDKKYPEILAKDFEGVGFPEG